MRAWLRAWLEQSRRSSASIAEIVQRSPGRWLLYCAWFALLVSLGEILFLTRSMALQYRVVQAQYAWWIPLGYLMLCGALTVMTVAVLRGRAPGTFYSGLLFVLGFVAAFGGISVLRKVAPVSGALLAAGLAVQVARGGGAHAFIVDRMIRRTFPVLAVLILGLGGNAVLKPWLAERRMLAGLPAAAAGQPNVLLIVLDTVRASSLSVYGDPDAETPNLARLSQQGVRFDMAISPAPWTLPAHASMFTGRWPSELSSGQYKPLDGRFPTLAEELARRGYTTAGFVANIFYGGAEYGLGRGFARYEDHRNAPLMMVLRTAFGDAVESQLTLAPHITSHEEKWMMKSAATINRDFLSWLSGRDPARPYFAFLNYIDAHDPYLASDELRRRFTTAPPIPDLPTPELDRFTPEQVHGLHGSYNATIAYLDQQIGYLFAELERTGALRDTIVVITADHGEHFGEHGLLQHAGSLYMPLIHVPLFISHAGHVPAGTRVAIPVSTTDLAATIADLTGTAGGSALQGRSLREFWDRPTGVEPMPRDVLSEVDRLVPGYPDFYPARQGALKSIVAGSHHYIRNYGTQRDELYDLAADPGETRDLAASRPDLLDAYRERIERSAKVPGRRPAAAGSRAGS